MREKTLKSFLALVLLVSFAATPFFMSQTFAISINEIGNPGFESTGDWEAIYYPVLGGYAEVQDDSKWRGWPPGHSGLTDTRAPKQESCSASLKQELDIVVFDVSTLSYWINKGDCATGYDVCEVSIAISGNHYLHYYHLLDGSGLPTDSSYHKYIDAGCPMRQNQWFQVSRDLFDDLLTKFSDSILDQIITGIELVSHGWKNLQTGDKYGQQVNWDDIYLESRSWNPQVSIFKDEPNWYQFVAYESEDQDTWLWFNITANVTGYCDTNGDIFRVKHDLILQTMITENTTRKRTVFEELHYYIDNWTCYGKDDQGNIVYKSTFIDTTGNLAGFEFLTNYFTADVVSAHTYIDIRVYDSVGHGMPPKFWYDDHEPWTVEIP